MSMSRRTLLVGLLVVFIFSGCNKQLASEPRVSEVVKPGVTCKDPISTTEKEDAENRFLTPLHRVGDTELVRGEGFEIRVPKSWAPIEGQTPREMKNFNGERASNLGRLLGEFTDTPSEDWGFGEIDTLWFFVRDYPDLNDEFNYEQYTFTDKWADNSRRAWELELGPLDSDTYVNSVSEPESINGITAVRTMLANQVSQEGSPITALKYIYDLEGHILEIEAWMETGKESEVLQQAENIMRSVQVLPEGLGRSRYCNDRGGYEEDPDFPLVFYYPSDLRYKSLSVRHEPQGASGRVTYDQFFYTDAPDEKYFGVGYYASFGKGTPKDAMERLRGLCADRQGNLKKETYIEPQYDALCTRYENLVQVTGVGVPLPHADQEIKMSRPGVKSLGYLFTDIPDENGDHVDLMYILTDSYGLVEFNIPTTSGYQEIEPIIQSIASL